MQQCRAAFVQIKGPNKPKDAFAAGADLPDSLGGGSVKSAVGAAVDKVLHMPLCLFLTVSM